MFGQVEVENDEMEQSNHPREGDLRHTLNSNASDVLETVFPSSWFLNSLLLGHDSQINYNFLYESTRNE